MPWLEFMYYLSRSHWPRGLRRGSAAPRLLRSWVRIPPGAWMFVCCECCVLSGRGLCDELITLPEESYRLWWVVVCDLETSRMRRPWPTLGRTATEKKWIRFTQYIKFKSGRWFGDMGVIGNKMLIQNKNNMFLFLVDTTYSIYYSLTVRREDCNKIRAP